ncbi:MAG: hypothetical protein COW30_02455 [Rhodospirillales bacterium CG15_BIG_FIL_POST_REV_8_21_14_020_66_15]|nr:MAG: hypothetical protein COW30_02455 [Rhodospirillales bacterium CG15_BIG_FIL_POST_REV_8_21_14_020_66_15]
MSAPDLIEQPATSVVDYQGAAAIRTEVMRGDPGRGGGAHVEFLTFPDLVEGLRIALELAQLCQGRIKKAEA